MPVEPLGVSLLPLLPLASDRELARNSALAIFEGESDTLAARQAFRDLGLEVFTIGLPGASVWKSEWADYVRPFPAVFICGDGDTAGHAMAERVKQDVPWAIQVAFPPGADARSVAQGQGAHALARHLELAAARTAMLAAIKLAPDLEGCRQLLRGEEA